MARSIKADVDNMGRDRAITFYRDKFQRELNYYDSAAFSEAANASMPLEVIIKQIDPQIMQNYRAKITAIKHKHNEFISFLSNVKQGIMKLFGNSDEDYRRLDALYAEIDRMDTDMQPLMNAIHNEIIRIKFK